MKSAFRLTTIFDIPVEINYSWFIILGLIIFTLANGYFPFTNPDLTSSQHWVMAVIAAILLFASLLAHELAHSLVAKKYKLPISGITLFIFGGVAHMEEEPHTPGVEFKMAIAGPIMSFFLAFVFYALSNIFLNIGFPRSLVSISNYLYMLNIVVGVFNLIPGFPLDGGRVLRALLWHFLKDLKKATAIASTLGKTFAFFLIAFGIYNIFSGLAITGIWMVFIGLFLHEAASVSYRQVAMKKLLGGTRVKTIMTKHVITVPATISLDKLVDDYFFKYRHASFPVIDEDSDSILGLVVLHDVKEILKDNWPATTAKDIVIPVGARMVIKPNLEVIDALAKMAKTRIGRLLVIEDEKLVGILSQRDIMKLFEYKAEIGD
ncbi:MAG: site-2 protease family protein [bacterium]